MMSELPKDLLEEILCRVPATSLNRLRSTCKGWNRLFNDKRFTVKHFRKAAKQSLILMLNVFGFYSMSINLHISLPMEVTGEVNLIQPHSRLAQLRISRFCHSSDGLLLLCVCVRKHIMLSIYDAWLVVWNPCTGQTKWIKPRNPCRIGYNYAIGSYQDNSYKILSHMGYGDNMKFEIYEVNSNSWRFLDVTCDFELEHHRSVSLKGNTYWFASDEKEKQLGIFLVSFDYNTESFGRLCLPYQYPCYQTMSLSVVREEKLSVLLQREITSKTEIWVTNKIGETKSVSWSKVLAVDLKPELQICNGVSFLVDEEKKVLVCSEYVECKCQTIGYIVGEDNKVREMAFGVEFCRYFLNYVPSLTQIEQGIGGKRKNRGE